jgi:(4S)-4-hydroxy-5-phosphonooxypentane-2,3-dione isomerase
VPVKPDQVSEFIDGRKENHSTSTSEADNLQFDLSAMTAAAHKQTAHYFTWCHRMAAWLAVPPQGVAYTGWYPA